jgi:hypothetical protein
MRTFLSRLVAFTLLHVLASGSLAQFGRPVPRPAPAIPRPVPVAPRPAPVMPHHVPAARHPPPVAQRASQPSSTRPDSATFTAFVASMVGLMAPPQDQGRFLAAPVLLSAKSVSPHGGPSVAATPTLDTLRAPGPERIRAATPDAGTAAGHPNGSTASDDDSTGRVLGSADLLVLGGLLLAAVFLVYSFWPRSSSGVRIRIISPPPGEAPEEVRRAWVELELPLARGQGKPRPLNVVGVLTQRGSGATAGYIVDGRTAIRLLESHAPQAAQWWRENAPHVVASGYQLVFPAEVCERIERDMA